MTAQAFGSPADWPDQDLIAFSTEFDSAMTLLAYRSGVFPMPLPDADFGGEMGWWSPLRRGVLEPGELRVSRSLRKSARRYTTTVDAAFGAVLARCADPGRPHGWIDGRIESVYTALHAQGLAHSVETWDTEGRLVGGLYGVSLAGLFAGESMFHDPVHGRDASKVALGRLVNELLDRPDELVLLDVQWLTDHLAGLGAGEISRQEYLIRLAAALTGVPTRWSRRIRPGDWRLPRTG